MCLYSNERRNSESSGSEESSLGVGDNSFSSSSDSNNSNDSSSRMSSSENSSSLDGMSSIDSTFIMEEVIQVTVQMYECMETGIEDNNIQWGKRILIEDLSEDDAVTHFCIRKIHLQEVANQLWPRLPCYLSGHKGAVKVQNGKYTLPFETLPLLVLYRFSRPSHLQEDMELFFGIRIARMSSSIHFMIHAMHALGVLYLDNLEIFHWIMPYYAERVHNKCGLTESVWRLMDGTLHKTCHPSYFQKLMYSVHKHSHGIKFQSIVTPGGLFASVYCPVNGN